VCNPGCRGPDSTSHTGNQEDFPAIDLGGGHKRGSRPPDKAYRSRSPASMFVSQNIFDAARIDGRGAHFDHTSPELGVSTSRSSKSPIGSQHYLDIREFLLTISRRSAGDLLAPLDRSVMATLICHRFWLWRQTPPFP
jgi:hypothetical protein